MIIEFKISHFTRKNQKALLADLRGAFAHAILSAANKSTEEVKIKFVIDGEFVSEENFDVFDEVYQILPTHQFNHNQYCFKWVFQTSNGKHSTSISDLWGQLRNSYELNKNDWMQIQIKSIRKGYGSLTAQ